MGGERANEGRMGGKRADGRTRDGWKAYRQTSRRGEDGGWTCRHAYEGRMGGAQVDKRTGGGWEVDRRTGGKRAGILDRRADGGGQWANIGWTMVKQKKRSNGGRIQ